MKIINKNKVDCLHHEFIFTHRVRGKRVEFNVVAHNEERAKKKAWELVHKMYKE